MNDTLTLVAPLSGRAISITEVPDPVFSQKMVGEGIAIDPINNVLFAPCDGTITQLHSAHHAVTITHESGVEVLMHIGLDTVALKGQGFTPCVKVGQYVTLGTPLIEFDADFIATRAVSLLTEVVITTGELVQRYNPTTGLVRAKEEPILVLSLKNSTKLAKDNEADTLLYSAEFTISDPTGLHARPAALIAHCAKKFQSTIQVVRGKDSANAKSVVSIMGIEICYADTVHIEASGTDAAQAVEALSTLLKAELDTQNPTSPFPPIDVEAAPLDSLKTLTGVSASNGLAVGHIFQWKHSEILVSEFGEEVSTEKHLLQQAIQKAKVAIENLYDELRNQTDAGKAAIFMAHQELLEDPGLINDTLQLIEQGKSAAFAWKQTISVHVNKLSRLKSTLIAARANDVYDVGRRVLQFLTDSHQPPAVLPVDTILIAEELTPSDTIGLDRSKVLGFCTTGGGTTSHVAILARALGIPAIIGIDKCALTIPDNTQVILDGTKAILTLDPDEAEVKAIVAQQKKQFDLYEAAIKMAQVAAKTQDGHRVEVSANVSELGEVIQSIRLGGEGIGLLRSEFLFLQRLSAPTLEEQANTYIEIAKVVGPEQIMVVRTLDVGGDKPLPYLAQPPEDNPFLGLRGLRLCLDQPDILHTQIQAILKAAPYTKLHIMFPMVTTLEEIREVKKIVAENSHDLGEVEVKIGIMVEVPAAAIMADKLAQEVDFFSIGTNDLTQYVLAMDRGNTKLAKQADGLNPAVLQLIAHTIKSAHRYGKWVGVCGGMASDPLVIPLLVGFGADELSVSVPAIPSIKEKVRHLNLSQCQALAEEVLTLSTAEEVRNRLTQL